MLNALTLAGWLAASNGLPVSARLELAAEGAHHLALRLCFTSQERHNLRYQLDVRTSGTAGTSRSQQSGELTTGSDMQCPINNRLGLSADTRVQATLNWSIDGQPQPEVEQFYPAK